MDNMEKNWKKYMENIYAKHMESMSMHFPWNVNS